MNGSKDEFMDEMESFFARYDISQICYKCWYNQIKILDLPKMVKAHLAFTRTHWGGRGARPYLRRLLELRVELELNCSTLLIDD